jgi:uncharacterized phage protein (TIGR01671 family)
MREIKFRAWDGNRMIYDHRLLLDNTGPNFLMDGHGEIVIGASNLMQFTGLKDKNGTEIYEGDIITHDIDGMIGIVTWSEGLYRFVIENLKQTVITADLCDYDYNPDVLGNIYENKELLK